MLDVSTNSWQHLAQVKELADISTVPSKGLYPNCLSINSAYVGGVYVCFSACVCVCVCVYVYVCLILQSGPK